MKSDVYSLVKVILFVSAITSPTLHAKVGEEETAKLGREFTPIGAEKAGNAEGTIPEWNGGYTDKPSCYKDDGSYFICDPFSEDKSEFFITNENKEKYKEKLSPGQIALFEKYPKSFRMPVYKTRRSAAYSQDVYDRTLRNSSKSELAEQGNGIANMEAFGFPFPIPKSALEVIWNHIVRYRGDSVERITGIAAPQVDGKFSMVISLEQFVFREALKEVKPGEDENVLFYYKQKVVAPSRLAGNVLLVHETLDQVKEPRLAWVYNGGQRRVRRAPQVGYDGPGTSSDGLSTFDNLDMYNGAPDRYQWELLGKREMFIPYNSYKLDEKGLKYEEILKPGHINSDLTRYELHRVWVIEAKIKPGTRHVYGRRTFYIDEDSWQVSVVDHYDNRGGLWRVSQAYNMMYYNGMSPFYAAEAVYDLSASRYVVVGLENEEKKGFQFNREFDKKSFTANALRSEGVR